jgi:hypothetical protein
MDMITDCVFCVYRYKIAVLSIRNDDSYWKGALGRTDPLLSSVALYKHSKALGKNSIHVK